MNSDKELQRRGRDTTLECSAIRLVDAIAKLGAIEAVTRLTYFEASPTKDQEAYKRWSELNEAVAQVKQILQDRKNSETEPEAK